MVRGDNVAYIPMRQFRYWCQKVLPLVYDDSLSYYEVLCKVVTYINELIEQDKIIIEELEGLRKDLETVQEWIKNFDTKFIEDLLCQYLAAMVFPGLTMSGYFVIYIPKSWCRVQFNTTEYDIELELMPEFGHLVLSY